MSKIHGESSTLMTTHHSGLASPFVADRFGLQPIANDSLCRLRQEAIASNSMSSQELPVARLWLELASGSCKVVDGFFSKTRCYIVTKTVEQSASRALKKNRPLLVLESVLRGSAQKALSFDFGLAASTISADARRGLEWIGVRGKPLSAHPLLILASSAAGGHDEAVTAAVSVLARENEAYRVVSVARPESELSSRLPPAELDIVRCLLEGHSHAGLGRLRGTSKRTIANQIASVFRRLGATCRLELIQRLFALSRVSSSPHPSLLLAVQSPESRAHDAVG